MPIEDAGPSLLTTINFPFVIKIFLILFIIFYLVFSLTLYRQIQWMARRLPTPTTPLLRFIAIVNIGVALTILFFVIGLF